MPNDIRIIPSDATIYFSGSNNFVTTLVVNPSGSVGFNRIDGSSEDNVFYVNGLSNNLLTVSDGSIALDVNGVIRAVTSVTSSLLNIDNIQIDGNTISSTNTNGNIVLDANGTGLLDIKDNTWISGSVVIRDTSTTQNGLIILKSSADGFTALDVFHGTGVLNRDVARFRNNNGNVLQIRGDNVSIFSGSVIITTISGVPILSTTDTSVTSSVQLDIKGSIIDTNTVGSIGLSSTVVATVPVAQYTSVFFDYSIKNGTDMRAGTVIAVYNETTIDWTESGTVDLGNTQGVTLSVDVSGGNIRLNAIATTTGWTVKTMFRGF